MLSAEKWMQLEITILGEVSKKKKIPYGITYMWNLKYNTMNLSTKQKQTHRAQTCGAKREGGEG